MDRSEKESRPGLESLPHPARIAADRPGPVLPVVIGTPDFLLLSHLTDHPSFAFCRLIGSEKDQTFSRDRTRSAGVPPGTGSARIGSAG